METKCGYEFTWEQHVAMNAHGNKMWLSNHMESKGAYEFTWSPNVAMNSHGNNMWL
jgi:hypothetical protein